MTQAVFWLQLDADLPRDRLPDHHAVRAGIDEAQTENLARFADEMDRNLRPINLRRTIERRRRNLVTRVAQLASSCVRSIRNLRVTSNPKDNVNCAISVHSGFLVPAAPSFCEAGPPVG